MSTHKPQRSSADAQPGRRATAGLRGRLRWSWGALILVVLLGACEERPAFLRPAATPHEAYGESLRKAGLHDTALGRDWLAAGERALREARPAKLPLEVATAVPAEEPRAFGFRVSLRRGRVLRIEVTPSGAQPAEIFIDLFRAPETADATPRHVASAERGGTILTREMERDGDYLVRIQPELLRSATFKISQDTAAALSFPVAGRGRAAIQSYFRDPRDGGRREHHGVDIFAPRDTPVLAASPGVITFVGTNRLGGNVVWLWDPSRGHSQYYAHLSRQAVGIGQMVQTGDILGYVGNTGNARGTPPHLHFGIYARGEGPVDPLPYVATTF